MRSKLSMTVDREKDDTNNDESEVAEAEGARDPVKTYSPEDDGEEKSAHNDDKSL